MNFKNRDVRLLDEKSLKDYLLNSIKFGLDNVDNMNLLNLNSKGENLNYLNYLDLSRRIDYIVNLYDKFKSEKLVKSYVSSENENSFAKLKKYYGKDSDYFRISNSLQNLKVLDLHILDNIVVNVNINRFKYLSETYSDISQMDNILDSFNVILNVEKVSNRFLVKGISGDKNIIKNLLVDNVKSKSYGTSDLYIYLDDLLKSTIYDSLSKHLNFTMRHGLDEFVIEYGVETLRVLSKKNLDDGRDNIYLEISDISEIKKSEEINRKLAYYDALTGLANRDLFTEVLSNCMAESIKMDKNIGLLFIDVDDFKMINDSYGHDVGDEVLIVIARALENSVRSGDLVARYAGDEFTIICKNVKEMLDLECIVNRIQDSITDSSMVINGRRLNISLSIGVSVFPHHSEDMDELINCADLAMYKAKNSGKNKFKFYNQSMKLEEMRREEIKNDLTNAIDRGEFYIEYMLQYDSKKDKYIGIESLMRWSNPDKGIISPLDFIGVAEDSGLIIEMGYWALDESLKHLKKLHDLGYEDMVLGVNFTDSQFRQDDLIDNVLDLINKYGVKRESLMIEISEKTSMWEIEKTNKILHDLRENGIKVCIDDFGTGYSSLKYLNKYPLTTLKIDKSFVNDIEGSDYKVIKVLLALSDSLGIEVVAEGVENKSQYDLLNEFGCDKFQGYYIGHPMNFNDLIKILNNKN